MGWGQRVEGCCMHRTRFADSVKMQVLTPGVLAGWASAIPAGFQGMLTPPAPDRNLNIV